jgi:hypothetical protein
MANYQKGKIYKIINDVNDQVYIGSTTQALSCHMSTHCSNARNRCGNSYFYSKMRQIGVEHFKIVLVKDFPCNSTAELEAEEYKCSQELNTVHNGYNSKNGHDWHTNDKKLIEECKQVHDEYLVKTSRKYTFIWNA